MCVGDSTAAKATFEKREGRCLPHPVHGYSFLDGWQAKAGGTLSAPNSTRPAVPMEGSAGCCSGTTCESHKQAWALPSVQTGSKDLDSLGLSGIGAEVVHSRVHSCCRRGLFLNRTEQQEGAASMK